MSRRIAVLVLLVLSPRVALAQVVAADRPGAGQPSVVMARLPVASSATRLEQPGAYAAESTSSARGGTAVLAAEQGDTTSADSVAPKDGKPRWGRPRQNGIQVPRLRGFRTDGTGTAGPIWGDVEKKLGLGLNPQILGQHLRIR